MVASVPSKRRPITALRGSNQADLDHVVPAADLPMQATLQCLVERYLNQHLMPSAIFCAERLFAHVRSQDNLWMLANCYFRNQEIQRACILLANEMDSCPGPGASSATANHYLFAICNFRLGNLREAEAALLYRAPFVRLHGPHNCREEILSEVNCPIPNGGAGLHLLGLICARDNRKDFAVEYFTLALTMDPFQWDAYEQLCALGANIPASAFFGQVAEREEHPVGAPTGLFPAEFDGIDEEGNENWRMYDGMATSNNEGYVDEHGSSSALSRSLGSR
jgi:tetratricopeptide (TPR) repeat protein